MQRNLYQADTFGTFPSVRLIEVLKISQCLLTINIQRLLQPEFHPIALSRFLLSATKGVITTRSDRMKFRLRLLCTVIQLHVVKEAIQSSSSLPFITNFNLFVNAKTSADFSTYFKNVIQYYYCQFSPVRNQPNTTYFTVRARGPLNRGVR